MTRRQLALSLLEEAGGRGVTTAGFLQAGVGSRYGARILELRRDGHVIEAVRLRDGSWRYTLVSDRAGGTAQPLPAPASAAETCPGAAPPPPPVPGAGEPSLFNAAAFERPAWMDAA